MPYKGFQNLAQLKSYRKSRLVGLFIKSNEKLRFGKFRAKHIYILFCMIFLKFRAYPPFFHHVLSWEKICFSRFKNSQIYATFAWKRAKSWFHWMGWVKLAEIEENKGLLVSIVIQIFDKITWAARYTRILALGVSRTCSSVNLWRNLSPGASLWASRFLPLRSHW